MARVLAWVRAPAVPLPARGRLPWWALPVLVAVLTWLQMVRRPSAPPVWDSLYVEDGQVFLSQAISQHFFDTLAASYQGYLHTAPRLIAVVATWFSLDDAPLVMSLLTSIVVALLAVYVYEASADWIASPPLRAVLGIAVVFVPVTARDMAGTVANLHWYLVYAAFWAVISPRRSWGWFSISAAVVLLAVLSDPLCVVLLPIAAVFGRGAGERRAWILPGGIVLGLLTHLALRDQGLQSFGGHDFGAIPRMFAERVTSSLVVGDRYLYDVFGGRTGSPFAWGSLVVVALAVGIGLWRLRRRRAWLLGGCAALSVAFFLIPVLTRGTTVFVPDIPWALGASRYLYLPVMFLLTGLLAAVDREPVAGRRRFPVRELAVALFVLTTIAASYRAPHRSEGEARWKPSLARARAACAAGRGLPPIRVLPSGAGPSAQIPIDPQTWYVAIACSKLR